MIIGAQMYTLRDQCRTLPDLFEALKKVADIGYRSVQLSGVCSYEAEEMADMLAATGLTADLTHFDYRRIIGDPQGTAAFHDRFDCRYVGLGSTPYSATFDGLSRLVEELREPVQKLAAANHPLLYHNHDKEFVLFDREGKPGRRSEPGNTARSPEGVHRSPGGDQRARYTHRREGGHAPACAHGCANPIAQANREIRRTVRYWSRGLRDDHRAPGRSQVAGGQSKGVVHAPAAGHRCINPVGETNR